MELTTFDVVARAQAIRKMTTDPEGQQAEATRLVLDVLEAVGMNKTNNPQGMAQTARLVFMDVSRPSWREIE